MSRVAAPSSSATPRCSSPPRGGRCRCGSSSKAVLSAAVHLAQAGYITGASERNWTSVGPHTQLPADFAEWQRKLLCDPQTSGGLLVACDRATAPQVMEIFRAGGFAGAREIGSLSAGEPRIHVA